MNKNKKKMDLLASKLRKINNSTASLAENSLSITDDFIDTGSYALNAIMSGSVFGGVPVGKVVGLSGVSGCGKTLIAARIVANAQKKGFTPIIWDTEGAWDSRMKGLGIDIDNCYMMPVGILENFKNQVLGTIKDICLESPDDRFIFVLDSLGALSSTKELEDAHKEKTVIDMGTRARVTKEMMRLLTYKLNEHKIPFIFTNHIYENPADMYKSTAQNQAGGHGPKFMSSIMVQFTLKNERLDKHGKTASDEVYSRFSIDDEKSENLDDGLKLGQKHKRSIITARTIKNRFIPPFLSANLVIDYTKGLDKYSGLFDIAKDFGIISGNRSYELVDGTKLGYKKDIIRDIPLWDNKLLPILDAKLKEELKYSDTDESNEEYIPAEYLLETEEE